MTTTYTRGDRVTWLQELPGGYGYTWPVDSVVVKVGPQSVLIEVPFSDGSTRQVRVKPETLRPALPREARTMTDTGLVVAHEAPALVLAYPGQDLIRVWPLPAGA